MCCCVFEPDIIAHFLFCCQNYKICKSKLLKNVYNLDETPQSYDDDYLISTLLYGSEKNNFNINKGLLVT